MRTGNACPTKLLLEQVLSMLGHLRLVNQSHAVLLSTRIALISMLTETPSGKFYFLLK
jgi:hypothetical protein